MKNEHLLSISLRESFAEARELWAAARDDMDLSTQLRAATLLTKLAKQINATEEHEKSTLHRDDAIRFCQEVANCATGAVLDEFGGAERDRAMAAIADMSARIAGLAENFGKE